MKQTILAIGSHPDDIEFGCAGTLLQYARQGHCVYLLVMTQGNEGGKPELRRTEQEKSAAYIGAKDIFWAGYEDTRMPFYTDVIPTIEKFLTKVKPSHVFIHYGKDTHQDHRHVSKSGVAAARGIPNVLFYEGPTTIDFTPNIYMNIETGIKEKIKILSCHKSQVMRTNVEDRSILDIAKATATFRGTYCRLPYAEAFSALRMSLNP